MLNADVIEIDPRSHLEVADILHRYSKNLRIYFREYVRVTGGSDIHDDAGKETKHRYAPFFEWLDDKNNLPDVICLCFFHRQYI